MVKYCSDCRYVQPYEYDKGQINNRSKCIHPRNFEYIPEDNGNSPYLKPKDLVKIPRSEFCNTQRKIGFFKAIFYGHCRSWGFWWEPKDIFKMIKDNG